MYLLLMVNTFFKNAAQPWAPEWRHATLIFSWLNYEKSFWLAIDTNLLLITDILAIYLLYGLTA